MADWVVFRTFCYQHEADFVKSVLESSGVDATVISDDCGGVDPALGLVRGVQLLVAADQVELATSVLEEQIGTAEAVSTLPE